MIRSTGKQKGTSGIPIPTMSDIFVHYLFGSKKYAPVLVHFVNAVLDDARLGLITKATVKNPFNVKSCQVEKETILDILAEDENSKIYDFEVQVAGHPYFVERYLYYWAKVFSAQLTETEPYTVLKPVTSIILTDFQAIKDIDLLHTSFGILSKDAPHRLLTGHFDMHFLRVPEAINEESLKLVSPPLKAWLTFFGYPKKTTEEEMKEASKNNPGVELAATAYNDFTQDPELRALAERREMFLRDNQTKLETLSEKKLAEGIAIGKAEGLAEGKAEGKTEQAIQALLLLAEWKLGELPSALRSRIQNLTDLDQINQIYEFAVKKATTIADLEKELG